MSLPDMSSTNPSVEENKWPRVIIGIIILIGQIYISI